MSRFLHNEWKESTCSFFANDYADRLPPPDAVRSPSACRPAQASATHESIIRTGLAEYPFIARNARTMCGTADLDRFLTRVMLETSASARNGFESLGPVARRAIAELIRMNRSTMDQPVAKPAPPTRRSWGTRAFIAAQPWARWTLAAGMSYQNSRYWREFAAGAPSRKDDYFSLDLSLAYAIDPNWSVRGEYQRTDQKSNIGFRDYNRDVLAVKLRYE